MGTTLRSGPQSSPAAAGSKPTANEESLVRAPLLIASWKIVWLVAVVCIAPWIALMTYMLIDRSVPAAKPSAPRAASTAALQTNDPTARISVGKAGDWGQLEYTRINVEMPSEIVFVESSSLQSPEWFFGGYTIERLRQFFASVSLTDQEKKMLLNDKDWRIAGDGITVIPTIEVVLSLSPDARSSIYGTLARFPKNIAQRNPFGFRPQLLDERIDNSALAPESIELLRKLLYPRGTLQLFADTVSVLPQLTNEDERIRFIKTVSRKTTALARLMITPDSDVDELVHYWGVGGRSKDLRCLLDSLVQLKDGTKLDVVHLLPSFARRRLYSFPTMSRNMSGPAEDCHWTTMNFFSDTPDDRYKDLSVVSAKIESDYYQIAAPGQLGDLVFVMDSNNGVVHSAVYIADDLVFTKNGARFTEPWTLMKIDDMVAVYIACAPPDEKIRVVYFRDKSL